MTGRSWGSRLFDFFNYLFLGLVSLVTVLPFVYIVSMSFSSEQAAAQGGLILFPKEFSLVAYRYIFTTDVLLDSMMISILVTVGGTLVNLLFTSLMAYPLAKSSLHGRKWILMGVVFTMVFGGGMIPTYFAVKWTGLLDSLWSLILPTAINAFNLIVLKSFFQNIPDGLEESAKIDGCNDFGVLFRIVLPLSLPALATFSLFYAVTHWNTYFNAIMYINDTAKWPVQVVLRQIVILSQSSFGDSTQMEGEAFIPPQTIKMAVIVFTTLPIMMVYPFLQKHFAKGAMLGSVKG